MLSQNSFVKKRLVEECIFCICLKFSQICQPHIKIPLSALWKSRPWTKTFLIQSKFHTVTFLKQFTSELAVETIRLKAGGADRSDMDSFLPITCCPSSSSSIWRCISCACVNSYQTRTASSPSRAVPAQVPPSDAASPAHAWTVIRHGQLLPHHVLSKIKLFDLTLHLRVRR